MLRIKLDLSVETPKDFADAEILLGKWLETVRFIKSQQVIKTLVSRPMVIPRAKFAGGGAAIPKTGKSIPDQIRDAVFEMPDEFQTTSLYEKFPNNPNAVKEIVKRMVENQQITVTKPKIGPKPATYQKTPLFLM